MPTYNQVKVTSYSARMSTKAKVQWPFYEREIQRYSQKEEWIEQTATLWATLEEMVTHQEQQRYLTTRELRRGKESSFLANSAGVWPWQCRDFLNDDE